MEGGVQLARARVTNAIGDGPFTGTTVLPGCTGKPLTSCGNPLSRTDRLLTSCGIPLSTIGRSLTSSGTPVSKTVIPFGSSNISLTGACTQDDGDDENHRKSRTG